jgi:microcompartment protein CcmL/EutN
VKEIALLSEVMLRLEALEEAVRSGSGSKTGKGSGKGMSKAVNGSAQAGNGSAECSASLAANNTLARYQDSINAMVPSWRLAEESAKKREYKAKLEAAEARIEELQRIIKAGRLAEIKRATS